MTRLLAVAAALAILAPAARADVTYHSYAFAKRYTVSIPGEALEKSPSWKEEAENPPLSARKAIKLATEMKDSLVKDSKEFKWKLGSTSLQPAGDGKWYWLVYYEAVFQGGGSTGVPNHLQLVVLMDGTTIMPVAKNYP